MTQGEIKKENQGRKFDQSSTGSNSAGSMGAGGTGDAGSMQSSSTGGMQSSAGRTDDLLSGGNEAEQDEGFASRGMSSGPQGASGDNHPGKPRPTGAQRQEK